MNSNLELFEIHITGSPQIVEAIPIKTIIIDLLRPDKSVLRTEYMTSAVARFENYEGCKAHVDELVGFLKEKDVDIYRVKIECPYYAHYERQSCYIESHFPTEQADYPISRNQRKTSILGTDRTYIQTEYDAFRKKWEGQDIELCLYDTNVFEDKDWFDLWTPLKN